MEHNEELSWYALRVFHNRLRSVKAELEEEGYSTYVAMRTVDSISEGSLQYAQIPIIPSLMFVRADERRILALRQAHFGELMVYTRSDGKTPAPIDPKQMEVFILVTSAQSGRAVEFFENAEEHYRKGDPVRVTAGIFKGAVGVVKRIKKDRKLLVAIDGVAIVAVPHIPMEFLEPMPDHSRA